MSYSQYLKPISERRTIYNLKPELPSGISIDTVQAAIQTIVRDVPTHFNCQLNRAIILTGDAHKKVWDSVAKATNGARRAIAERDETFGTVVFFVDEAVTRKLQNEYPAHHDLLPLFGEQVSGAAQVQSWVAVESMGMGANLQHFNQFVQDALPADIPKSWVVKSQLCFGLPTGQADVKEYVENPVKVY
ncbi:hypothetical protein TBLA_0A05160 [Henningerozyma blattae CBS 6284]|uniref:Nitroreductase domain-containing protein n=1 Tax=Henningerozyma blattae (strain ATCC 34711 / CBS 6284 / DSM 70876 / NBRC 10599 / NRRL Y-10934 / UCD 77-7) TaxID=1071380 RepID=I2GW07_HENB6|nr:hypothetical protein TBLA_0A05160 [Tetrapisispora blattae CBS 6284]CCH58309.1 hypothetical protein TBLA_0A05160 [Tetrapisispora blattae CBS 6284]